jgi:hypothetical protein
VGLSATLDQRRSPQRGGRLWRNLGKNHRVFCLFSLLRLLSFLVLIFTCDIAPSLIIILREQSSEEFIFLSSSHPNLVLVCTNTFIRPNLCCLKYFSHDHLFTPLGALNWYQSCFLHQGTNCLKRWILKGRQR